MKTAITGTIGAGKSTVSGMFRSMGYPVFDADVCTHMCLRMPHPCCEEVLAAFGEELLQEDGTIDRTKLGGMIFNDEERRLLLNSIVHPHVLREMLTWMDEQQSPIVFAEVALLFEAGWDQYFDETIVVTCTVDTAVRRMVEYRGYTEEEAHRRIRSQIDREEQIRKGDTIFRNDGTLEQLRNAVQQWTEDRRGTWN